LRRYQDLILYEVLLGRQPFREWLENLRDKKARYVIRTRLDRLAYYGHAGKCEPVGKGVFELKIFLGPGYRVYLAQEGQVMVLLLCGGDKRTQRRDIIKAQVYLSDYRKRVKKI